MLLIANLNIRERWPPVCLPGSYTTTWDSILVHENLLVNEQTGRTVFRDFVKDKGQMARLFEAFVANFYRRKTNWDVRTQVHIPWDSLETNDLLPEMRADAVVEGGGRLVVVECKFYEETLQVSNFGNKPKLHSTHLYQLSAYLQNMAKGSDGKIPEGLLIYPSTGVHLLADLTLVGRRLRACTIDLMEPWEEIAVQMHKALGYSAPTGSRP